VPVRYRTAIPARVLRQGYFPCDRPDCRRRAFPPLDHRLALDPLIATATPYRFEARDGA